MNPPFAVGLAPPCRSGPALRYSILAALLAAAFARADAGGGIVVVREHGVGTASQAEPYLQKFVERAAKRNGWGAARGRYFTSRTAAREFIRADAPRYGVLSLPAFLALRREHDLEVLGKVTVWRGGGRRYHLVSRDARDMAGCKGETLSSNHADDARFVDRVVFGDRLGLADFEIVAVARPLQPIKQVMRGQARCALIDDAQHAELAHIEGAESLRTIWTSGELPPMAVVAFPGVSAKDKQTFQESFDEICTGEGKSICAEIGIVSIEKSDGRDYLPAIAAYGRTGGAAAGRAP